MNTPTDYFDAIDWLTKAIASQRELLENQENSQASRQIDAQKRQVDQPIQETNALTQKSVVTRQAVVTEKNRMVQVRAELLGKRETCRASIAALQAEKSRLSAQVDDQKKSHGDLEEKISAIEKEIEAVKGDNGQKKALIVELAEGPSKLTELTQRLERAMALKAGYLAKARFTEELLKEQNAEEAPVALEQYKTLCEELKNLVFDR